MDGYDNLILGPEYTFLLQRRPACRAGVSAEYVHVYQGNEATILFTFN